ncbi:MAG: glycosyltransferase [Nitrospirae bacterium]|nr:glycosyltransferase [Nitrospirota bacterium]
MILYSVIIPAYNAEGTIRKCLDALEKQNIPGDDYEVIVVDDGSIDKTPEIVKRFPVKYFPQPNKGPASARNRGAGEAKGEIILFTDADCVPQESWIKEMIMPFKDPAVIAVKGAYKTNQKSLTARFAQAEFEERFEMLKKADSIDMVDTYSAAFRKPAFLSFGGFDPSFPVANNEDTELSYKMSRAGCKMVFNPAAIVFHLKHPDTIKKYARLKFWRGYWRIIVYKRYPDKMFKDSYTPQTLKLQIFSLLLLLTSLPLIWLQPRLMSCFFIVVILLFMLSSLPFTMLAAKNDLTVAVLSPFFLSVRAASLGLGAVFGFLRGKTGTK